MPPDSAHETHSQRTRREGWAYNARLGLVLFFVYLILYGGFVALATFAPKMMGQPAVAGVNLAIVYGFGLIVAALVLAIVYMFFCNSEAPAEPEAEGRP